MRRNNAIYKFPITRLNDVSHARQRFAFSVEPSYDKTKLVPFSVINAPSDLPVNNF
jgi:hypothetical protein